MGYVAIKNGEGAIARAENFSRRNAPAPLIYCGTSRSATSFAWVWIALWVRARSTPRSWLPWPSSRRPVSNRCCGRWIRFLLLTYLCHSQGLEVDSGQRGLLQPCFDVVADPAHLFELFVFGAGGRGGVGKGPWARWVMPGKIGHLDSPSWQTVTT